MATIRQTQQRGNHIFRNTVGIASRRRYSRHRFAGKKIRVHMVTAGRCRSHKPYGTALKE